MDQRTINLRVICGGRFAIRPMADRERAAIEMIERGIATMRRTGWEPGETDNEWIDAAEGFIDSYRFDRGEIDGQGSPD